MVKTRNDSGKFEQLGKEKRQVRSIRLTDSTYEKLSSLASKLDMTIADYVESNVDSFPSEVSEINPLVSASEALDYARQILKSKKSARKSMESLLKAIYSKEMTL